MEWLSYSIDDFLLFSLETYQVIISQTNRTFWPITMIGATLISWAYLGSSSQKTKTLLGFITSVLILVSSAYVFYLKQYQSINWASSYMATVLGLQVLLLLSISVAIYLGKNILDRTLRTDTILVIYLLLALIPMAQWLLEQKSGNLLVVGIAPLPSVIFCILIVSQLKFVWRIIALALPIVILLIEATTLMLLEYHHWQTYYVVSALCVMYSVWPKKIESIFN